MAAPTSSRSKRGTGLRYTPVNDFALVPKPLIEQIKPAVPDVDRLYNVLKSASNSASFWSINFIGVFADHEHIIKGFMWFTLNPITRVLHCHMLSVDREYQNKGVLAEAKNIGKKLMREVGASKLTAATRSPKVFERIGFTRSALTVMELEE